MKTKRYPALDQSKQYAIVIEDDDGNTLEVAEYDENDQLIQRSYAEGFDGRSK